MEFDQHVASRLNFSLDCLLKSWSSYLTSIPAEDISSLEVVVVAAAVDPFVRGHLVVLAATAVGFPAVHTMDVALDICPSDRTSSFRSGRTAGGACSTGPDSGSLALEASRMAFRHYHYPRQEREQIWNVRLAGDISY